MNKEYQDFCTGILIGILILCVILAVLRIVNWKSEYAIYENKLVIKYHNPTTPPGNTTGRWFGT